ncbi:MAG: VWA domain-containing protein [Lachnospiraceae bacterium]|nr:VWA domain-containing protein [Lachnospiraceae bacterium]
MKSREITIEHIEPMETDGIVEEAPKKRKSSKKSKSAVSKSDDVKLVFDDSRVDLKMATESGDKQSAKKRVSRSQKIDEQSDVVKVEEKDKKKVEDSKASKAKKTVSKSKKAVKVADEDTSSKTVVEDTVKKTTKTSKKKTETSKKKTETVEKESWAEAVKTETKTEKVDTLSEITDNPGYVGNDVVISFDTTGSMYSVLASVRRNVASLVKSLSEKIDDLRICIIMHGDYCDANNPYTIRVLDFTTNVNEIVDFVTNTKATYGGDPDECYELVLHTANNDISWRENSRKTLILIGDSNPHGVDYSMNKDHLDWNIEVNKLADKRINVFAVHALSYFRNNSKKFYETLAYNTNGTYLTLDQFSDAENIILATCYAQNSVEKLSEFVEIIRNNHTMTDGVARNINRLAKKELVEVVYRVGTELSKTKGKTGRTVRTGRTTDETLVQADGLVPVTPGRFQTLTVDDNCAIKQFVLNNGLTFKTGRGFYELSKAEDVQQYKEVILQDKETGLMYNGAQVREHLGLKPQITAGGETERLHFNKKDKYRVFVQSTSVNRKLIGGTEFLYEVDDI